MKNYISLVKITLKYWPLYIWSAVTMVGYAVFSAASVPLFIPLMDDVLNREFQPSYEIESISGFFTAAGKYWDNIFSGYNFSFETISDLSARLGKSSKELFMRTDPMILLQLVIFAMILLTAVKTFFFIFNRIAVLKIEGQTTKELKDRLFLRYINFPFHFFERHKVGDALVRLSSDVVFITQKLLAVALNMIRDVLLLLLYLFSAILINPGLFLKIVLFIPPLLAFTSYLGNKIKKYTFRLQKQLEYIFNKLEEVFRGLKIVRAFAKEKEEAKKFDQITRSEYNFWFKRSFYDMLNVPLSELSGLGIAVAIIWFGGKDVLDPDVPFTFGKFIAFLSAILMTLHPLKITLKNYNDIKKASVSLDRLFEVLNQKAEITDDIDTVSISKFTDKIEFKNVYFSYSGNEEREYVLKNINLTIRKGEKVAIVGGTGSGKTTLINLLPRFYTITEGSITIDGHDINKVKIKDLRSLYGYVTQESFLFNDTIVNNVSYGLNKPDLEKVKQACEIAFASEFVEKLENGYEYTISNYGANLSGGQRQRLCIARAIIHNPEILLFDEATSALDSEAENKVQEAINNATKNKTLVVIAHRLSTILNSDRIIVLKDGEIVGNGPHEELIKNNAIYQKLYELQFKNHTQQ
jgi:ABC-type multidrug transport system fused ATPase/permease subunit